MRTSLMKRASALILLSCATTYAWADAPSAAHGNQVFQYWCAACHGAGPGHPGTDALAAKYHGTPPALLEQRTDLTVTLVKFYVRHGLSVMPMFRKTEISDSDLADVAAYIAKSTN